MIGHTLTDGMHVGRRNDVGSDGTPPGEMKRGLGMAHHYHTIGHENQSITTRRQLSAPPGGTRKTPKQDLRR